MLKEYSDYILWALGVLVAVASWAFKRNEKEHEMLWAKTESLEKGMLTASSGLNDRIMDHIDSQITDVKSLVREEDRKINDEVQISRGHIAKLFDKIEAHAQRSEDRHIETLNAIHTLANTMHSALATKADK